VPKPKKINPYREIAKKYGVTINEVETEIAQCIRAAWQAPQGSSTKELQLKLFPDGKIPANEEFIRKIAENITNQTHT
jgi:hypothetical protein